MTTTTLCTNDDRCDDGTCSGDAITCVDALSCTVDTCDPSIGCVFLPNHTVCADDDPCSTDTCDPASTLGTGCTNEPAPNGTLCGEFSQCGTVELCVNQLCVTVDIPPGTPCFDGNACTDDDQCSAGSCLGTPVVNSDAVVETETFRHVSPRIATAATHAALAGDAIVVADRSVHVLSKETLAPIGHLDGFPLRATREIFAPARGDRVVIHADTGNSGARSVFIVDVSVPEDPRAIELITSSSYGTGDGTILGGDDNRLIVCDDSNIPNVVVYNWDGDIRSVLEDEANVCNGADEGASVQATGVRAVRRRGQDVVHVGFDFFREEATGVSGPVSFGEAAVTGISISGNKVAATTANEAGGGDVHIIDYGPTSTVALSTTHVASEAGAIHSAVVHDHWLYFATTEGVRRADVTVPTEPVVDTSWSITGAFTVVGADDDLVLLQADDSRNWLVADAQSSGSQTPLPLLFGHGGIDVLAASEAGQILAAGPDGIIKLSDASLSEPEPLVAELPTNAVSVLFEGAGNTRGFYVLPAFTDGYGAATVGTARSDRRESIRLVDGNAYRVRVDGGFAASPLSFSNLGVGVTGLHAVDFENCAGAAATLCSSAACSPQLVAFSACSGESIVLTHAVSPSVLDPDDVVSGSIDGTHMTFLGTTSAALLDTNTGVVLETEVEELQDALFASASYEGGLWLIIASYAAVTRFPRAMLFDVSSGTAVQRASFDVGAPAIQYVGGIVDIGRRALGIIDGVAYVSDWDPTQPPGAGHSVVLYNLAALPPAVMDVLPLAGEPTSLVEREAGIVVGRVDGVSVIAPICAEPSP